MSTLPRRPRFADGAYHHGDLRQTLLRTARELVAELGIDGFSLREVSRRAGVSHTAAYNHFADRSALVRALAVDAYRGLTGATLAAARAARTPQDRLQAIGVAYVEFAVAHPAEFRFMFRPELCAGGPGGDAELEAASIQAYTVLVDAVATALNAGTISGDAGALTLAAWSLVHGLATLILDGPDPALAANVDQARALARQATAILFSGMANADTSSIRSRLSD